MNAVGLVEEYHRALLATRYDDLHPLIAAGVTWETIAKIVPANTQITLGGATYEPDPDGGAAYLIPVRVDNPLTPEAADPPEAVRSGAIIDLLAFHPAHPYRWALRRDAAEWLGPIEPQYLDPEPVEVWRTPLRWLQAGCHGLVLLSSERESQHRILSGLGSIVAEDHHHAAELRSVLNHSWSTPPVIVREVRRAA